MSLQVAIPLKTVFVTFLLNKRCEFLVIDKLESCNRARIQKQVTIHCQIKWKLLILVHYYFNWVMNNIINQNRSSSPESRTESCRRWRRINKFKNLNRMIMFCNLTIKHHQPMEQKLLLIKGLQCGGVVEPSSPRLEADGLNQELLLCTDVWMKY